MPNKRNKIYSQFLLKLICVLLADTQPSSAQALFPISSGKIVFHRYTDWTAWDGQLFIYDFTARSLDNISMNWDNIEHTTNAHFSPDGTKLVFMAVPKGARTRSSWNIYLWTVGSSEQPKELLQGNSLMDQDPKFFPDGLQVTFKHNGDIGIVNTTTGMLTKLTNEGMLSEKSMEYPTADGKSIIYVEGDEPNSFIYKIDIATKQISPIVQTPGVQNYYSIVRDDSTLLYARWASSSSKGDDIYLANINTGEIQPVVFNLSGSDDSDPYPVDSAIVLFSSNRSGGKGGYDLWIGNLKTGETRSLNLFGINTVRHELGVCYTKNSLPLSVLTPDQPTNPVALLHQNYPNPFNPETTIRYELMQESDVTVDLFDVLGKKIATLVNGFQYSGEHRYVLNTESYNLQSGIYFYRITAGSFIQTKTMVTIQ
ncbi:MAG: T9SS type A sorting domain-containing protein [Bacteroidota bacterium]|nr:T9SS type A sorting domain-containing protein [Bacteroidota bacterium]